MTDGILYQSKTFHVDDVISADQLLSFQDSEDKFLKLRYEYVQICGSLNAAAVLSEIVNWTVYYLADQARQGWHYKTAEDWESLFRMSRKPFEAARGALIELGLIYYRKEGMPLRSWYRANLSRIVELRLIHRGLIDGREFGVDDHANPMAAADPEPQPGRPTMYAGNSFRSQFVQKGQTSLTPSPVCPKRTNKNVPNGQTRMSQTDKLSSCKETTKTSYKETRGPAHAAPVLSSGLEWEGIQSISLPETSPASQNIPASGPGLATYGNLALVSDTAAAELPELDTVKPEPIDAPSDEQSQAPAKFGPEIKQGMAALITAYGPIPDNKAQAGAIKWLLSNGWEITAVIDCLNDLRAEGWRSCRVSYLTVKKEIGAWALRAKDEHDQASALELTPAFHPDVEAKTEKGRVISITYRGTVHKRADYKAQDFDALVASLRVS